MIRVLLALAVLLSHLPLASYKILSGGLAVQSFFVISGFYMALVLDGKYRDAGLFWSNRILRLAPTYFFMLVLGAIALFGLKASVTSSPELMQRLFSNPVSAVVLVLQNLLVFGQDLLFWFTVDPQGNPGVRRLRRPGQGPDRLDGPAGAAVVEPVDRADVLRPGALRYAPEDALGGAAGRGQHRAAPGRAPAGCRLPALAGGGCSRRCCSCSWPGCWGYRALPLIERAPRALGWIAAAGLIAFCLVYTSLKLPPGPDRWVTYAVVTVTVPWIFNAFKDNRWDRWIGDLSYPVYLSQLIVIGLVLTFNPPFPIWMAIGGTFAISIAIMLLIERPVDRWRQKRLAARQAAAG